MTFPHFRQPDSMDCGATCLRMVAKHHGRSLGMPKLRSMAETTRQGASLRNMADAAERIGFRSLGVKVTFAKLQKEAPLPCIVHWNQNHFVVVYRIAKGMVHVADPAHGLITYSAEDFIKRWIGENAQPDTDKGIALLLEPTPCLTQTEDDDMEGGPQGFSFLFRYLFRYKKFLVQLAIGLLAGSLLQLFVPFLTQSIVDIGIQNRNLNFIYLILIAQLFLFVGRTGIDLIRGWILLHLSTRINISLVSDFFIKLMALPISFFDVKMTGDIMQRINDHQRIERFLTSSSLNVLFSMVNLLVFGIVLVWYSPIIFTVFLVGSVFYFGWVVLFLKKRKELDHRHFSAMSGEQSKVIELINGMQEIKLHNAEKQKRWSWEYVQARLFRIEIKSLRLTQTQEVGARFINELKNILVTVLAAKLVIDGQLTLGMMLSVSYIMGQLDGPISQMIGFMHTAQDAKIALERLAEIHGRKTEEQNETESVSELPTTADISFRNVHFRYTGSADEVIKGVDLTVFENQTTAIVGASGSGKTTLMKMMLKFYEPNAGDILVGNCQLNTVSHRTWRDNIGVVMQDGYIFNDTIANNIAIGEDVIDKNRLRAAVEVANIREFIENLPMGYNTKVGMEGVGLSGGEKQRLFIARAVYRNPRFLFFDEATSSLDAENERIIMQNLTRFFKQRTAVVIAHRLSTVKNADQIIVLDKGRVIESGTHDELIALGGSYFRLVKDQLKLEQVHG